jgi:hypothetical protein
VGCINSREDKLLEARPTLAGVGMRESVTKSPLTVQEIESRMEAPKKVQSFKLGKVDYRYAYVSQRGYYPDGNSTTMLIFCSSLN